jgi:hypothetical protein
MTKTEIDVMWNRALREAIEGGEEFTRYRFAAMVASAEREACAKVCEGLWRIDGQFTADEFAAEIRARAKP